MALRICLIVAIALTALARSPAYAQSNNDPYTIMRPEPGRPAEMPEPWLPPKYKSPRGTPEHIVTPEPLNLPPSQYTVPPPLYVPQTGQMLPNLPSVTGAGPNGLETSQDRALRCANQAGVYGAAAGDRNTYVNSCVNQ
jgi:hypothetical protein